MQRSKLAIDRKSRVFVKNETISLNTFLTLSPLCNQNKKYVDYITDIIQSYISDIEKTRERHLEKLESGLNHSLE